MKIKAGKISLILAMAFLLGMTQQVNGQSKDEVFKDRQGLAIKGYDAVAYQSDGEAVKGSGEHEVKWKGASWRFANAEHKELFQANPEKYAPQYGGYCAWAVSRGYTAGTDPKNAWRIVDGKLYLNYNSRVQQNWAKDIPGNIKKADANWPKVLN